jgi:hypothetical protein
VPPPELARCHRIPVGGRWRHATTGARSWRGAEPAIRKGANKMPLAPPGIAQRWTVIGQTIAHWECTTLFDLPADDRAHLVVHPAAVTVYSLRLDRDAVRTLLDTIAAGNACAVPARHAVHGERLLGLRPVSLPNEPRWHESPADSPPYHGPMELYLHLPDAQIEIRFRRAALLELATILAMAIEEMSDAR